MLLHAPAAEAAATSAHIVEKLPKLFGSLIFLGATLETLLFSYLDC